MHFSLSSGKLTVSVLLSALRVYKTDVVWFKKSVAELPAAVAQLVERVLGKDEVMGSNPISSLI